MVYRKGFIFSEFIMAVSRECDDNEYCDLIKVKHLKQKLLPRFIVTSLARLIYLFRVFFFINNLTLFKIASLKSKIISAIVIRSDTDSELKFDFYKVSAACGPSLGSFSV